MQFVNYCLHVVLTENEIENFPGFDNFISKLKFLSDSGKVKLTEKSLDKLNKRLKIGDIDDFVG